MTKLASFVTTPTRGRANAALAVMVLGTAVIGRLTDQAVLPLLLWLGISLGTVSLLRVKGPSGVTNLASLLAGRPIAVTARGRATVSRSQATDEMGRALRGLLARFAVVAVALALVLWLIAR